MKRTVYLDPAFKKKKAKKKAVPTKDGETNPSVSAPVHKPSMILKLE